MTGGVIFCHGDLGKALLGALSGLFGPVEYTVALSNTELSHEEMVARIEKSVLYFADVDAVVIFTDMKGGSCWQTASAFAHSRGDESPEVAVISGVNLPMLVAYANKREKFQLRELVQVLIDAGRDGVN